MASVRPLTLRFSARARTQLISILEYIEGERGHAAAVRIAENIREAAELLCYFPYAGRLGRVAGTREWVVRRLPYVIVYEPFPNQRAEVTILGIFHGRQDRPG